MRTPKRKRRRRTLIGAKGWKARVFALYGKQCVACGNRAAQAHHVVARQAILTASHLSAAQRDELAYDEANGVPICLRCHERHETAAVRIPFEALPAATVEWAFEHGFSARVMDRRVYPMASS